MAKLKLDISMSVDGFVAGPNPTLEDPLGWAPADRTRTPQPRDLRA